MHAFSPARITARRVTQSAPGVLLTLRFAVLPNSGSRISRRINNGIRINTATTTGIQIWCFHQAGGSFSSSSSSSRSLPSSSFRSRFCSSSRSQQKRESSKGRREKEEEEEKHEHERDYKEQGTWPQQPEQPRDPAAGFTIFFNPLEAIIHQPIQSPTQEKIGLGFAAVVVVVWVLATGALFQYLQPGLGAQSAYNQGWNLVQTHPDIEQLLGQDLYSFVDPGGQKLFSWVDCKEWRDNSGLLRKRLHWYVRGDKGMARIEAGCYHTPEASGIMGWWPRVKAQLAWIFMKRPTLSWAFMDVYLMGVPHPKRPDTLVWVLPTLRLHHHLEPLLEGPDGGPVFPFMRLTGPPLPMPPAAPKKDEGKDEPGSKAVAPAARSKPVHSLEGLEGLENLAPLLELALEEKEEMHENSASEVATNTGDGGDSGDQSGSSWWRWW